MNSEIFRDVSINTKEDDKLSRAKYAEQLSSKIFNYRSKESLVVGLSGEWGSGKTSILKMVVEAINKNHDENLILIKFNPWYFSNQKELINEFFNTMIIA
ncbi:MAG: KAP family NTPase [Methanobrevibacter sp.]|jgi:predicted KAP-like P-loop ATPase|nr:KAP family NTPase [Methanobrevibacter sp.]